MLTNALDFLGVAAVYGVLFLFLPYWLYNMRGRAGDLLTKVLATLSLSTTQVVMSVYLLAFLHLLSAPALWLLILLECAVIWHIAHGRSLFSYLHPLYQFTMHVHAGYFKPRVMLRNLWQRFLLILRHVSRYVRRQPLFLTVMLLAAGYALYIRIWSVITNSPYGVSDLYVYTQWIKALLRNHLFSDGVYFFGLHNTVAGLSLLSGTDVVTVLRTLGVVIGMLTYAALYWLLRNIFSARWHSVFTVIIFACFMIFDENNYFRQSYPLAQEFSQLFWLISGGFFVRFLRARKQEDLLRFGVALGCIVLSHYYGVLITALFCIAFGLTHLPRLFAQRARMLRQLIAVVAIAMVVALLPMAIGLLSGIPLQGSFGWGLKIMAGDTSSSEAQQVVLSSFGERFMAKMATVGYDADYYVERSLPLLLGVLVSTILLCIRRARAQGRILLGLTIFQAAMFALILAGPLGIPELLDWIRATMFYAMTGYALYAMPLELITLVPSRKARTALTLAGFLLLAPMGWHYGLQVPHRPVFVQKEGAVRMYYKIKHEYPRGQWTIVSPVEETSLVENHAYHYELYEFLRKMDPYTHDTIIEIPTRYVFFYMEKIPLNHELVVGHRGAQPYPLQAEEAQEPLPYLDQPLNALKNKPYNTYSSRRILMAKVGAWAEAFMRQFPNDMSVYYEDDEFIVYRYQQNMYRLTNFAIDYGYNPYLTKRRGGG